MTCSDQAERGTDGAAAREGCRTAPSVDPEWQAEQRRKNETYAAYRRQYADVYRDRQLEINPLLKDWLAP